MHRLDPTTTILTAALALMTALALLAETPFVGGRGRSPVAAAPPVSTPAPSGQPAHDAAWVAMNAMAVGTLSATLVPAR